MQRLTSIAKKTGELASVCERTVGLYLFLVMKQLTRSFAEVPPKIPRKAPAATIPRKSGSTQKVTTRMSNKYAYPIYTTAGVVAGLAIYEVFRCKGDIGIMKDRHKVGSYVCTANEAGL